MAHITTRASDTGRSDLAARLAGVTADLRTRLARRRLYTRTLNELSTLTDRDLSDLGISRSMIRSIAHEAAYGRT